MSGLNDLTVCSMCNETFFSKGSHISCLKCGAPLDSNDCKKSDEFKSLKLHKTHTNDKIEQVQSQSSNTNNIDTNNLSNQIKKLNLRCDTLEEQIKHTNKIVKYEILSPSAQCTNSNDNNNFCFSNLTELNKQIQNHLNDGWSIYGEIKTTITSDEINMTSMSPKKRMLVQLFSQAMCKYE